MTITVLVGSYRPLPEPSEVMSRAANAAKAWRSRTPARLSVEDTLLERLPQDIEDVAAALGPFILEEYTVVGQRHVARHRHVAAADQPHIGDGVMGGATRSGRDQSHTVAFEAGNAMEARSLQGLSQGHGRQDGGEPPGQGAGHEDLRGERLHRLQLCVRTAS
jgi:hypothetical protein